MARIGLLMMVVVAVAYASSHSEAPGTTRMPAADLTDLYAFRSYETGRAGYTVLMMNANPVQAPFGGPNYHALSTDHYYYFHIDNDADGAEDISFEFMFSQQLGGPNVSRETVDLDQCTCVSNTTIVTTTANIGQNVTAGGLDTMIALKYSNPVTSGNLAALNFRSFYECAVIFGDLIAQPTRFFVSEVGSGATVFESPMDYVGPKTFPAYTAYAADYVYDVIYPLPGCSAANPGKMFVGQRKDTFSVNLGAIFDLLNMVPVSGFPTSIADVDENNALDGYNIDTFALEIPTVCLAPPTGGVIGVWSTTHFIFHNLGIHEIGAQYSRLGQPLINELVIGLGDKAIFNAFGPINDAGTLGGAFLQYVGYPWLPEVINREFAGALNGGARIAPTNFPRNDLIQAFLLGVIGVNANAFAGEYMRLNTSTPVALPSAQSNLGVINGDAAGFPNGRRPGDDVVDIILDVMMGRLCHLNINCTAIDAPTGNLNFLDGAPQDVGQFDVVFPFAITPLPGFVSNVDVVDTTTTTTSGTTTGSDDSATNLESFWVAA